MDQICPRCGCRSFHYNRSRMRVECDACGHALTDPQELQLQLLRVGQRVAAGVALDAHAAAVIVKAAAAAARTDLIHAALLLSCSKRYRRRGGRGTLPPQGGSVCSAGSGAGRGPPGSCSSSPVVSGAAQMM